MSNGIQYDSLLVRALADTLSRRLAGRRVRALRLDRESRTVTLSLRATTLRWDLAPNRGWLLLADASEPHGNVDLAPGTRIAAVTAPVDERVLTFALDAPPDAAAGGHARSLVIELIRNRWNALVTAADGRISLVLLPRDSGGRTLRAGEPYRPPAPPGSRTAIETITAEQWRALLSRPDAEQRRRAVLANVAYTSPINVPFILGAASEGDDAAAASAALDRLRAVVTWPDRPGILRPGPRAQPYPFSVDPSFESAPDLIEAFHRAAMLREDVAAAALLETERAAALDIVRRRRIRLERRKARLEQELEAAREDAEDVRGTADLLLAQLHHVRRGATHVELDDFQGGVRTVELDPALTPAANAERLYAEARRRDRARKRLPALIARTSRSLTDACGLEQRIATGEASPDEIAELTRDRAVRVAASGSPAAGAPAALPYRVYRTSGGHEVRVGRGAKANDALTFHHSSPYDIWLHARDAAGAHVILRWSDREAGPPASALVEAAVLAALHSRARTSGAVPVDWTRRRYVRKPRRAAPGLVTMERAKTLFVEPDPAVERRLRVGAE